MNNGFVRSFISAVLTFSAIAVGGFVILILLFKLGIADSVGILFYRGFLLCIVSSILTMAITAYLLGGHAGAFRDAFAGAFMSFGLNLGFLVLAPVTVDRSISVFILGYMAAQDEKKNFTTEEIKSAFRDVYVGRMRQIDRRMEEQHASGNVVGTDAGWALSPQGQSFITLARGVGWLFDIDQRLVDQRSESQARLNDQIAQ